ncbi:uncharacterized protein BX663DRAFT_522122 [Cokeromyces recurvatus]|uniref:uncharacterized protein n=1 Tax=Cokeromyces recurvatus TaxID=90255 RepID=UPI00221F2968|nr:uncharacterized protein BX663DRAFT_522122 [Cokeromyces recurvatus]KAI7899298.1 hypothetical protein BX663DRAFT_522122 [Cokeromyces recurvatus]
MSSIVERVFIVGGTGNIGRKVVNDLLDNNVAVTLYARNPVKVQDLFSSHKNSKHLVNVVQGDYHDLSPIQEGIKGHTRLFLLVADFNNFVNCKLTISQYAYVAGVQQIVDISSFSVNAGWRESLIGSNHYLAEKAIFEIPNRGHFVALRPGRFMSNIFMQAQTMTTTGAMYDITDPNKAHGWISPNDIGAVAAVILREDIKKHADAVYHLTGDVSTPSKLVHIISSLIDRDIAYIQISPVQKYNKLMETGHISHLLAIDLIDNLENNRDDVITPTIEILLGRKPETLEEYLLANKSQFY